jgi:hypothetical protein
MPPMTPLTLSIVSPPLGGGAEPLTTSATPLVTLLTGDGAGGVAAPEMSRTVFVTERATLVPAPETAGGAVLPGVAVLESPPPPVLGAGETGADPDEGVLPVEGGVGEEV